MCQLGAGKPLSEFLHPSVTNVVVWGKEAMVRSRQLTHNLGGIGTVLHSLQRSMWVRLVQPSRRSAKAVAAVASIPVPGGKQHTLFI